MTTADTPKIKVVTGKNVGCMYLVPLDSLWSYDSRLNDALGDKDFDKRNHDRLIRRVNEILEEHLTTPELREAILNQPPSPYTPDVIAWNIDYNGERSSIQFSHHRYQFILGYDHNSNLGERYYIGVYRTTDEARGVGWGKHFEYSSDMAEVFASILEAAITQADLTAIHGLNIVLEETLAGLLEPRIVEWDGNTGVRSKPMRLVHVCPWNAGEQVVGYRRTL